MTGFYHTSTPYSFSEATIDDQLAMLYASGLYNASSTLAMSVLGHWPLHLERAAEALHLEGGGHLHAPSQGLDVGLQSYDMEHFEVATLTMAHAYCTKVVQEYSSTSSNHNSNKHKGDATTTEASTPPLRPPIPPERVLVYYLHSKGVTHAVHEEQKAKASLAWRSYMEYFLFNNPRWCVRRLLEGAATCGVEFRVPNASHYEGDPQHMPHYSGNYWWARCDYIASLPPPTTFSRCYFCGESWIGLSLDKRLLDQHATPGPPVGATPGAYWPAELWETNQDWYIAQELWEPSFLEQVRQRAPAQLGVHDAGALPSQRRQFG